MTKKLQALVAAYGDECVKGAWREPALPRGYVKLCREIAWLEDSDALIRKIAKGDCVYKGKHEIGPQSCDEALKHFDEQCPVCMAVALLAWRQKQRRQHRQRKEIHHDM